MSLTETAAFSKKASVWVGVGIVAIIFLLILLGIVGRARNALFPPKPLPPTVAFWKLPRMDLSEGIETRASKTFTLETVTGGFPMLPTQVKVFAIGEGESSFGQPDDLKRRLTNIGFDQEPVEISPGVLKFVDSEDGKRTMTVELATGNFTLERDLASDPAILNSRPTSIADAKNRATDFLRRIGVNLVDFPTEKIEVVMLRVDGSTKTPTDSLSTANLIQLSFMRDDLDELPVIWPVEGKPNFYVTVSENEIVEVKMVIRAVQKFKFATYPLKGPERAFEDLKRGAAAFNKPVTTSEVTILDIKLGYVESTKNEKYLLPVYLFRGTGDLVAYVPAVDDIWIK